MKQRKRRDATDVPGTKHPHTRDSKKTPQITTALVRSRQQTTTILSATIERTSKRYEILRKPNETPPTSYETPQKKHTQQDSSIQKIMCPGAKCLSLYTSGKWVGTPRGNCRSTYPFASRHPARTQVDKNSGQQLLPFRHLPSVKAPSCRFYEKKNGE